jgi:hypothetical protein
MTAQIKVGETYKAANGKTVKIIDAIMGGCFLGDIGDNGRVVYRYTGKPLADGWAEYSIEDHLRLISGIEQAVTAIEDVTPADRLDKLEAMCTDIFRQLRNTRSAISEKASLDSLEGTDRRVEAIRQGVNDAGDLLLKHEDRLNGHERALTMIRADIGKMAPFRPKSVDDRIASLEAALARIEDMLTTERDNKSLLDLGTGEKVAQAYPEVHQPPDIALSDPAAAGCNCRTCQRERAELRARIEAAAVLSAPAFPSFLGFMIAVDPSLAEGVIEFRDNTGNVLGTFKAEKRA